MIISGDNIHQIKQITPVHRVVSLVPSLTETIASLGGKNKLVGITRFCKYPLGIEKDVQRIGGTKSVHIQDVESLSPDLIVAVKEENEQKQVISLAEKFPVVVFDISNLNDALKMLEVMGMVLGQSDAATALNQKISKSFEQIPLRQFPDTLYLIWRKPWMAAGKDTFINDMMRRVGFENRVDGRYPELGDDELAKAKTILLSSEPYPFTEKHRQLLQDQYPEKKILLVDGEMFSWYGSRLLKSARYFKDLQKVIGR